MITAPLEMSASLGVPPTAFHDGKGAVRPAAPVNSPFSGGRPPRILLVDDEPINIKVARKYLTLAGYTDFCSTSNSAEVLPLMIRAEPDVVLLDVVMPNLNGFDLLAAIRADAHLAHIPVVMLTAADDRETKLRALESGATDFLGKPVDPSELVARVRNALVIKAHHDHLRSNADDLERQVKQRTTQLEASRRDIIHCLARTAEFRDDDPRILDAFFAAREQIVQIQIHHAEVS